jgi:hypothetical protein
MASWTDKRIERLKLLHKEGSASVIAKKLGAAFTKGMVVGKLRRNTLEAEAPKARTERSRSSEATSTAQRASSLKAAAVKPTPPSRPIILRSPCQSRCRCRQRPPREEFACLTFATVTADGPLEMTGQRGCSAVPRL